MSTVSPWNIFVVFCIYFLFELFIIWFILICWLKKNICSKRKTDSYHATPLEGMIELFLHNALRTCQLQLDQSIQLWRWEPSSLSFCQTTVVLETKQKMFCHKHIQLFSAFWLTTKKHTQDWLSEHFKVPQTLYGDTKDLAFPSHVWLQ